MYHLDAAESADSELFDSMAAARIPQIWPILHNNVIKSRGIGQWILESAEITQIFCKMKPLNPLTRKQREMLYQRTPFGNLEKLVFLVNYTN